MLSTQHQIALNQLEQCFDCLAVFTCKSSETEKHTALLEVKELVYSLKHWKLSEHQHKLALLFLQYRTHALTADQLHTQLDEQLAIMHSILTD